MAATKEKAGLKSPKAARAEMKAAKVMPPKAAKAPAPAKPAAAKKTK